MTGAGEQRTSAGWFFEGARQAVSGPAWIVGLSLASVGGLAHDVGLSASNAVLSTLLVWAGPAQLIFFTAIATGVAPFAIALAVTLASVRFVPMVVSLLPLIRGSRTSLATQIFAAHFVAVTVWVETMRRAPGVPREQRMAFYFGLASGCILTAAGMTLVGYEAARMLPTALAAALLFITPIYFIAASMRGAREAMDWVALGFGLTLAPFVETLVGGGLDLLVTGLIAGLAAYAARLAQRARRRA
ncbi:MAG: AzlC family ABC transporter permease [Methylobacteriaceae bacterium]|nr:AzlC family ABC transporter permease [Methylobacteriaceae bacterium]